MFPSECNTQFWQVRNQMITSWIARYSKLTIYHGNRGPPGTKVKRFGYEVRESFLPVVNILRRENKHNRVGSSTPSIGFILSVKGSILWAVCVNLLLKGVYSRGFRVSVSAYGSVHLFWPLIQKLEDHKQQYNLDQIVFQIIPVP